MCVLFSRNSRWQKWKVYQIYFLYLGLHTIKSVLGPIGYVATAERRNTRRKSINTFKSNNAHHNRHVATVDNQF